MGASSTGGRISGHSHECENFRAIPDWDSQCIEYVLYSYSSCCHSVGKLDRLRRSKNFPKIPKRKSRFQAGNQFLSLYDLFFIKEKLLASSRGIEVQSSLD